MRKANATTEGYEADGYVTANVSSAAAATVYGRNTVIAGLSGLTVNARYFLSTTGGGMTTTPPAAAGNVVQYIGKALSATELLFQPEPSIKVP